MNLPRIAKHVLSSLIFLLGLAVAFAASVVAAYKVAKATQRVGLLITVILLVFFFGILLTTVLTGKLNKTFQNRHAVLTGAVWTFFFLLVCTLPFPVDGLRPYRSNAPRKHAVLGYSKCSHIAYSLFEPPAGVSVNGNPIVFVHGGAGLRAFDTDHNFFGQFSQDGFPCVSLRPIWLRLVGSLASCSRLHSRTFRH